MTDFRSSSKAAEMAMRSVFAVTPLQRNAHLSGRYGAEIYLKREDLSPVRSYKIRGALNAMRKAVDRVGTPPVFVCASAGNHAQGVAYMCKHFGVKGEIFMPVTTPAQKVMKTRLFGGDFIDVQMIGDYFDETLAAAQEYCAQQGAHFLSPFDDADVIEGQASVAIEVEQQLGRIPDYVMLPVGGGGLSAGIYSYFGDGTRYRFCEPVGGACFNAALKAGKPVALDRVDSFADGAAVGRIGDQTFDRLKSVSIEDSLMCPEDRICITMLDMLNVEGVVLEPAGALAIDGLQDVADQIRGKTVVCIVSGGNFDFERLPEVKERAQRHAGLKKYLILRLPQRPGALKEFLGMLGPNDDITRFEYLKKSARNFGSVLLGIEVKSPDDFPNLFSRMDASGFSYRDITDDTQLAEFVI